MFAMTTIFLVLAVLGGCQQDSEAKRVLAGEVEVDEIDVASRIPARIIKVMVQPGQKVAKGDLLVRFDDDILAAKKRRALATIEAAQSKKNMADDAVRPEEKEQIKAAVSAARKQRDFAQATFKRTEKLFKQGAISRQAFEEVEFKFHAASQKYRATLAKQKMADVGARDEQRSGAQALLNQAETGLEEVEAYRKDLELRAPFAGEVFKILNHEGELVPQGYPVVTLLKTDQPWVTLFVTETKLARLPMGTSVSLSIPALNHRTVMGTVSYIAPQAAFATLTTTQDRSTFDLKTFEIRLTLAERPDHLRPGMTAVLSSQLAD